MIPALVLAGLMAYVAWDMWRSDMYAWQLAAAISGAAVAMGFLILLLGCSAPTAVRLPDAPRADSLRMAK